MNKLNIKIKIPTEWYAGFTKSRDGLPRVYMTPHGTDKVSQTRAKNIQRFTHGEEGIPDAVMDNKPLCGFKIVKPVNYGYNTSKVVWLIEDPRGFVSEIPSGNMGQLLALTTVDHCEILERYYSYGRDKKPRKLSKMAHYYMDTDGVIHSYGNGNVAELVDATSIMTPFEAETFINNRMVKILMSVEPNIGVNTSIDLIPIDVPALSVQYANTGGHEPYKHVVIARMPGNVMAYCDYPHFGQGYNGKRELEFREIVQSEWVSGFLTFRTTKTANRWGNGYSQSDIRHNIDLNNIPANMEFYEVQFTWQTPHGEFKKMRRR